MNQIQFIQQNLFHERVRMEWRITRFHECDTKQIADLQFCKVATEEWIQVTPFPLLRCIY
jgi:hypothetical protein